MAGISQVLNIAKNAILTHQMAIQVAGHNVANVDTPGYTRQSLQVDPALAYPSSIGPIGNGVTAELIKRSYDSFATQRIMQEEANLNNLSAQNQSIRMVEAAFNEAPGLALNDLMNQFWTAWQNLADNPEMLPARQTVVQQAELIANQLNTMNAEIVRTRNDIGVNLKSALNEANSLIRQLADLNVQIAAAESDKAKANDMRDQRDVVLKQLSGLIDINYFETNKGMYTVLLPTGHALVENTEHWPLDWENDSLQWVGTRRNTLGEFVKVKTDIGSGAEIGGKIGGWLEIYNRLDPMDSNGYAGRIDSFSYSFIREINRQHSQGVGMTPFSGKILGTATAKNTGALTSLVDTATAIKDIPSGTFTINGRAVGRIEGGIATSGLATIKAYNSVTAFNEALAGVTARLTTQVAGSAVTAMAAGDVGQVLDFTIEGAAVSYTVQAGDVDPAVFAANVAAAITAAMSAAGVSVAAKIGDGGNGGAVNSIILFNATAGDDATIRIEGIDPAGLEGRLGLTNDIFSADLYHNTGEVTLLSGEPFTVQASVNDEWLAHYNWDGGSVSISDQAGDGLFTYEYGDGGVDYGLLGYPFGTEIDTEGTGFDIWLYNSDGTLALPQAVTVSMERAFTLTDVVDAINSAITSAGGQATWLQAAVENGQLSLQADGSHKFAFGSDTSGILAAAGINTLFVGDSAGNIGVNQLVAADVSMLGAATVSAFGDIFRGDNSNALAMTNLQRNEFVTFRGQPDNSFDSFYNSLVAKIGMNGQIIKRDMTFHELLSSQLNEMRDSTSGVSLDEEMTNLMKFQHAYTAAAKLITMSDEMLQTLLQTV